MDKAKLYRIARSKNILKVTAVIRAPQKSRIDNIKRDQRENYAEKITQQLET